MRSPNCKVEYTILASYVIHTTSTLARNGAFHTKIRLWSVTPGRNTNIIAQSFFVRITRTINSDFFFFLFAFQLSSNFLDPFRSLPIPLLFIYTIQHAQWPVGQAHESYHPTTCKPVYPDPERSEMETRACS